MSQTSTHNCIYGFTDTETVLVDFDNTSFKTVRYWARRVCKWFKLDGFIILKSSERSYHVVFNRRVSWSENLKIVAWVSLHSHSIGLNRWLVMQCIKQGSTLRVSPKFAKPSPRIVFREGNQNEQIKDFLVHRALIKRIIRKMNSSNCVRISSNCVRV